MTTLEAAWSRACSVPDRRPIHEWAHDHVDMPAVLTIHGKFNPEISRHFLDVFSALQDDHVRQVCIRKPARGGGTLISDVWHVWCRANRPGPAMAVLQTDQMAKDHAEARLMPMMTTCEAVKPLLPTNAYKIRTQEIIFTDGLPLYVVGPSLSELQTKGIRYMSLDEPWLYKPGIVSEAEGRLGDYLKMGTSKLLIVSQAGEEDDDFDRKCREGDACEWMVQCEKCALFFEPRWTGRRADGSMWGMRWDTHKTDRGFWVVEKAAESVRYECQHCAHPHMDTPRTKGRWNETGKYQPTNPAAALRNRSFHWRATIDYPWRELLAIYLNAENARKMGIVEPLIQFFQKYMAEPRSEKTLLEGSVDFKIASYDVQSEWSDEAHRFMTVDRQEEDLFWIQIRAWSKTGETRRLWFGKVFGFSAVRAKQEEFKVSVVLVDSGFLPKGDNGVYAACVRYGWVAVKGEDTSFFWHHTKRGNIMRSYSPKSHGDPESGMPGGGKRFAPLIRFSATKMADRVNNLTNRNLWVEPIDDGSELEAEYRRQMTSEYKKRKVDKFTGRVQWLYVCPSGNNHAFDCAKMQVLAATLADLLPDEIAEAEPTASSAT